MNENKNMNENAVNKNAVKEEKTFTDKIKDGIKSASDNAMSLYKKGKKWCKENEELINDLKKLAPVIIAGAVWLRGQSSAKHKRYLDRFEKETRFYDPRLGRYSYTRRMPTPNELLEIEKRYRSGESYRRILDDLRILR